MDRWKIESAGSAGRAYTLDQLRTMISAGLLKPSDRVVQEDGSASARVGDLLPPEPVDAPAVASPSTAPQRKGIRWLLLGGAILLLAAGGVGIYYATRTPEPSIDLPEWFDPAYRIQKNRAIIYPRHPATRPSTMARREDLPASTTTNGSTSTSRTTSARRTHFAGPTLDSFIRPTARSWRASRSSPAQSSAI